MKITEIFVQNILNFQSLSLLIGRLITDGNFQVLSVLYHPNSLDDRLLNEIISHSPTNLQLMTHDITKNGSTDWNKHYGTDHVIQLIFVDRDYLVNDLKKSKPQLYYNKIFVLVSTNEFDFDLALVKFSNQPLFVHSDTFLLVHNLEEDSTKFYSFPHDQFGILRVRKRNFEGKYLNQSPVFHQQRSAELLEDAYKLTFGRPYRKYDVVIQSSRKEEIDPVFNGKHIDYEENFKMSTYRLFFSKLLMNHLNTEILIVRDKKNLNKNARNYHETYFRRDPNRTRIIYDEVMANLNLAGNATSNTVKGFRTGYLLIINGNMMHGNGSVEQVYRKKALYPHEQGQIVVLVIQPQIAKLGSILSEGFDLKNLSVWFIWILVGAIILFILRMLANVRSNSPSAALLELISVFFGGGNLTWSSRVGNIFLLNMLIGAFFFNSIFGGILFDLYKEEDLNRIDTFAKLAEADIPLYLGEPVLRSDLTITSAIEKKIHPDAKVWNWESGYQKNKNSISSKPYAYVTDKEEAESILKRNGAVVQMNIINEPLLVFYRSFFVYLVSNFPRTLENDFNKLIQSTVENGLSKFYDRIAEHLSRIKEHREHPGALSDRSVDTPVTLERLQLYINFYMVCMTLATVVFIGELCWKKRFLVWQKLRFWKNRMSYWKNQFSLWLLQKRLLWRHFLNRWRLFRSNRVVSVRGSQQV